LLEAVVPLLEAPTLMLQRLYLVTLIQDSLFKLGMHQSLFAPSPFELLDPLVFGLLLLSILNKTLF
jgi:hypothetical protein